MGNNNKKYNLCRGSYHEHVCKVLASSPLWLLRRRFKKKMFSKILSVAMATNQNQQLWLLRRRFFNNFSKSYPLCCHDNQSNSAIWTKFIWIVDVYSRNISVEKNLNICSETAKIDNFHFSHFKSMETISCHSNQSSYPIATKNTIIRSPLL